MHAPGTRGGHLTYCLNIHPGESWEDVKAAVTRHALVVKKLVSPDAPFGLGLRLAAGAVEAMRRSGGAAAWRDWLTEHGLYVFTVNGFPYGTFHGSPVKTGVYRPDWRTPERLNYTLHLAEFLAELLPEGQDDSISTSPGSYKAWLNGVEAERQIAGQLAAAAAALAGLERRTGREIHLGLEPEPDCMLETTGETVRFFNERLIPDGTPAIRTLIGCTAVEAERLLRRHVGICVDTCHLAIQGEELSASLESLQNAGIRVSKMQLSAALKIARPASAAELAPFADEVYLHQVKAWDAAGGWHAYADLPEYLAACRNGTAPGGEARVHVHVPLDWRGDGTIQTTADALTAKLRGRVLRLEHPHIEVETYTFNVLPPALRARPVEQSLAAELRYAMAWLQGSGKGG